MEKYHIEQVDLHTATDEFLEKYFDYGDIMRAEQDPDEQVPSRELRKRHVREKDPHSDDFRWVALTDDKSSIVGVSVFEKMNENAPAYEENKHIGMVSVRVIPAFRKQGLGTHLLQKAVEKATEYANITVIFGNAALESGDAFAAKFGGTKSLTGAENRLYLANAQWDVIRQWRDEGHKFGEKQGVELQFFENCPEDIIEEYTDIYSETMNQQPLGDFDGKIMITPITRREDEEKSKRIGTNWYTMITRESDGHISGLTEMMYIPDLPHKAFQNLTGVREKYRGRSLGKWLKAELLLWIVDKYPAIKYVVTGNATSNAPMLSINERMGFKQFKTDSMYSFQKEDLVSQLNLN